MKLPNRSKAIIKQTKITRYLLDLQHPEGKSKAIFFRKVGFTEINTEKFKASLLEIGKQNDVIKVDKSKAKFVTKYVIDGDLLSPKNGKSHRIRTVWKIEIGHKIPELVTAYRV